jgi:hypothetical protein
MFDIKGCGLNLRRASNCFCYFAGMELKEKKPCKPIRWTVERQDGNAQVDTWARIADTYTAQVRDHVPYSRMSSVTKSMHRYTVRYFLPGGARKTKTRMVFAVPRGADGLCST